MLEAAGDPHGPRLGHGRTHAERLASRDGYFAPGSVIRRVGDTPLLPLLGGGPAVLLQVAHPLVAAGVVEHSDFRRDLWRRLHRTLQALYYVVFGSKEEAERVGAAVQAVHERVRGRTSEALGPFPAGTPYDASDPELMLWVHATLVEVALAVHGRFVERLSTDEEEAFYREMGLVARLLGTPSGIIPPTLAEFRGYFRAQLEGPALRVTRPAREVAGVIFDAPLPAPLRALLPAYRLATAGLLPPRLRAEYGLAWTSAHGAALAVAGRATGAVATPLFRVAERVAPPVPALARAHPLERQAP